jgi:formate dehydrogenase major subunit
MNVTRRDFIKISGAAAVGMGVLQLGFDLAPVKVHAQALKIQYAKQTTTICPYCAVGCGIIVHTDTNGSGRVINTEGDPDHPINQGSLCAKGAALYQFITSEHRLTKPLYREPYGLSWREVPWEWALSRIAKLVKTSRDATFMAKNDKGQVVNRANGIAHLGSAALDNEECWLIQTMMRALGLVYIEHQARI